MYSSRSAARVMRCAKFLLGTAAAVVACSGANASEIMLTGGLTSQPIGHYEFCKANPAECRIRTNDVGPERMTGVLWRQIVAVNAAVNAAIKPMNDFDVYGTDEVWAYPDGVGDCEDYVLEKRRDLMRKGVALSNLLITVVRKPDGEGHAVLTVRTNKGDFVLDNLTDSVRQWDHDRLSLPEAPGERPHRPLGVDPRRQRRAAGQLGRLANPMSIWLGTPDRGSGRVPGRLITMLVVERACLLRVGLTAGHCFRAGPSRSAEAAHRLTSASRAYWSISASSASLKSRFSERADAILDLLRVGWRRSAPR